MGKKRDISFKSEISKILLLLHPSKELSPVALELLNSIAFNIVDVIVKVAARLVLINNTKTLSARDIQTAVRLKIPMELGKHAISEGTKSVTKFNDDRYQNDKKRISKEKRAGISIKISTCRKMIERYQMKGVRVSESTAVYLAGVVDYMCCEIIELGGNASSKDMITPVHIMQGIREDSELSEFFSGFILGTGVYAKAVQSGGVPKTTAMKKKIKEDISTYVSVPSIQRLLYRAGIQHISSDVYPVSQKIIHDLINIVVRNSIIICLHRRHKTVQYVDGMEALKMLNLSLYHVKGYPGVIEPCKGSFTTMSLEAAKGKRKPGEKAIKLIERFRDNPCTVIPHEPIVTMMKLIGADYHSELRYEENFLWLVHAVIEHYFVNMAIKAFLVASHCGRVTIKGSDISLVKKIDDIKVDVMSPKIDVNI